MGILHGYYNWGTYSKEEYLEKNVTNPNHKGHEEFLQVLNEMKDLPFFTNHWVDVKNTKFRFNISERNIQS